MSRYHRPWRQTSPFTVAFVAISGISVALFLALVIPH